MHIWVHFACALNRKLACSFGKWCTFAYLYCTMFHQWRCHASLFTPLTHHESLWRTSFKSSNTSFSPDLWGRREFKEHGLFEERAYSNACLLRRVNSRCSFPFTSNSCFTCQSTPYHTQACLAFLQGQMEFSDSVYMQSDNPYIIWLEAHVSASDGGDLK